MAEESIIRQWRSLKRAVEHAEAVHKVQWSTPRLSTRLSTRAWTRKLLRAQFVVAHEDDLNRLSELVTQIDEERLEHERDAMRATAAGWRAVAAADSEVR